MTTTAQFPVSHAGGLPVPQVSWPTRHADEFPPAASSTLNEVVMLDLTGRATPIEAFAQTLLSVAVGAAVSYGLFAILSFASIL